MHRVQRDAAVNPAGGIAGEDMVRHRRQHEILRPQHRDQNARSRDRQLGPVHPADQDRGQHVRIHLHQACEQVLRQAHAYAVVIDPRRQQPDARIGVAQSFGKQVAQEHHRDAPFAQHIAERHVFDPCLLDPDHIVEQQRLAVLGCQPRHLGAGTVDHDAAQSARLGMNAVGEGHAVSYAMKTAALSAAMVIAASASSSGQMKRSQRS